MRIIDVKKSIYCSCVNHGTANTKVFTHYISRYVTAKLFKSQYYDVYTAILPATMRTIYTHTLHITHWQIVSYANTAIVVKLLGMRYINIGMLGSILLLLSYWVTVFFHVVTLDRYQVSSKPMTGKVCLPKYHTV